MTNNMLKIAHRGSLSHAPENTLRGFKKAVATHVDMIELDVRVCKTGEPVVMHDSTVNRTTNGKGKVNKLTLAQIKQLTIDGKEQVPTLSEVIESLGGKVILNIEIKTHKTTMPVVRLLKSYIEKKRITYDDIILASANVLTLRKIYRKDKNFHLSVIVRYLPKLITSYAYRFELFSVQPLAKVTSEQLVTKLREKGIKVFPWALKTTEDGKKFIQKMKKFGIDGIISFFPEKITESEKE